MYTLTFAGPGVTRSVDLGDRFGGLFNAFVDRALAAGRTVEQIVTDIEQLGHNAMAGALAITQPHLEEAKKVLDEMAPHMAGIVERVTAAASGSDVRTDATADVRTDAAQKPADPAPEAGTKPADPPADPLETLRKQVRDLGQSPAA